MSEKIANENHLNMLEDKNPKFEVNIQESWFIRYNKEGLVFPHTHGGSWCCVYYLQIGEDSGKKNGSTFFLRPYVGDKNKDFGSKYLNHDTVVIEPKEGKLLIWPNYMKLSVAMKNPASFFKKRFVLTQSIRRLMLQ